MSEMQKYADIIFNDNIFFIQGDLDFFNVMSVYEKSLPRVMASPLLQFDFSQLKSSDSSGLALIIEWIKLARQHNKKIHFLHLSKELMSIANAAGLDKLIMLSA